MKEYLTEGLNAVVCSEEYLGDQHDDRREQFFHLLIHEDPGGQLTKAMLFRVKSFAELSLQGLPNDKGLVTTTTSNFTKMIQNKTISDGGITADFSIIKVHTSN